jgi:methylmalonyl-CoA/ethylmalonyl-CoA epimerase
VPVGIAWFGLTGRGTDAGALGRFLERRGEGVYGLALVVDDYPATIAALEDRGAQIVRQESSGQTFVHPKTSHGVLIDLVPERHPSRLG